MKVFRPELLLCALLGGVLGWCPPVFLPTEAGLAMSMRGLLWCLAVVSLVQAFRERPPSERPRTPWRPVWLGLKCVAGVAVLAILGMMHVAAILTGLMFSWPLAIAGVVLEMVGLVTCAGVAWRRPALRPWTVGISAFLLFAGSFQYVLMVGWMWSPVAPEVCAPLSRPGEVDLLSPAEWASEPSQPFSLLFVPDKAWLLAAFKMGGNGGFSFWDDPASNRIMGLDVRKPSEVESVSVGGLMTTLHMAYRPESEELLVSRQGATTHALQVLSTSEFPRMSLLRSAELELAPNILITHPKDSTYGVLSEHGVFTFNERESLAETERLSLSLSPEHVPVAIWEWHAPGTTQLYISVLVYPLVAVDMATREVRWSPGTYGGGQLVGHAETSELFVTDMVRHRLDVLEMDDLERTRGLALDYTPRAVAIDPSRDLLMVGAWFGGTVVFYRLSTLEPLNLEVPVGPTLRDFAIDTERGLLFAASACGVYQVNLDALVGTEGTAR